MESAVGDVVCDGGGVTATVGRGRTAKIESRALEHGFRLPNFSPR